MKCACPACGKKTALEADVGDFPSRCQRCGALLRAPTQDQSSPQADRPLQRGVPVRSRPAARSVRIEQGVLAGLLVSSSAADRRSSEGDEPMIIHGSMSIAGEAPPERPKRLLRPESLREIARASARQKALRRATLRGNHQVLGFLGKLGFVAAAILCLAALVLEARLFLNPTIAHADTIKSSLRH